MNWFKRIFLKEKLLDPIDLSVLKTDIHSHLIPGIDDGAQSMEDAIAMIKKFSDLGYKKLVTTPHIMSDFYKNSPETILPGLSAVREKLKDEGIDIELNAAAEYYLDESLEGTIKERNLLTIADKYVLFELPFIAEPPNLSSIIFDLQTNGYTPILAHPERYGFWYKSFEKYQELKDKGVHLQLNMLSLIGHYSPETQKIAERLVDENLISFLGSDCHNHHHQELIQIARRKPYLHQLIESGNLLNSSI